MSNKLDGITLHAEGEANCYRLMRGGNWLAAIRMNGELLVWDQEAILRAMLQADQQPHSAEAAVPQWRYDALIQHAKHQDKVIAKLSEEKNTAFVAIKIHRIMSMHAKGKTPAEIAEKTGWYKRNL
jgi:ABC-type cobalamin transport system ATPase subunit